MPEKNKKQNKKNKEIDSAKNSLKNVSCPEKDKDGNCRVPGVHSDSDPIGGG